MENDLLINDTKTTNFKIFKRCVNGFALTISVVMMLWSLCMMIGIDYPSPKISSTNIQIITEFNIIYFFCTIYVLWSYGKDKFLLFISDSYNFKIRKIFLLSLILTLYSASTSALGLVLIIMTYDKGFLNIISFLTGNTIMYPFLITFLTIYLKRC